MGKTLCISKALQSVLWHDEFHFIYHKDAQEILISIYEPQQNAFENIIMLNMQALVLVKPNKTGAFSVFSDTCIIACGSALYQEQKSELRLAAIT